MGISGKYNFKGIKKTGGAGLKVALSLSPWTSWLLSFGSLLDLALELFSNWLANRGLIILNIGVDAITSNQGQKGFDDAMDEAFRQITNAGGVENLTPEQIKELDDAIIKATRKLVVIGKPK